MMPSCDTMSLIMPAQMTHDKKLGKMAAPWIRLRVLRRRNSLSISAKVSDASCRVKIFKREIYRVFQTTEVKLFILNMNSNHCQPTQGDLSSPRLGM